jgi:hypothetical protein
MLDGETGEGTERRLEHGDGEARAFYAALPAAARVGIEATGHTQWFELVATVRVFSDRGLSGPPHPRYCSGNST